jgi:hypothetical protein
MKDEALQVECWRALFAKLDLYSWIWYVIARKPGWLLEDTKAPDFP